MTSNLTGKVAIITASTHGIGFAIAQRLASEGASVVITGKHKDAVDRAIKQLTSQGHKAYGLVCDTVSKEGRDRLVNMTRGFYGRIDILVLNEAATSIPCPIWETSEEAWDEVFDTNVKSAFFLTKAVAPIMHGKGGGSIVFVSSVSAYRPENKLGAYSVSKTTLLGLTKALTNQCASLNIRVNVISPGLVKTASSKPLWSNPKIVNTIMSQTPLKRLGLPEDCAGAVSFLVSNDASYVTGENIVIAGGMTSRL